MKINTQELVGFFVLAVFTIGNSACSEETAMPKPMGYPRIEVPTGDSVRLDEIPGSDSNMTYNFFVNQTARWEPGKEDGWGDLVYPWCHGRIQLTYKPIRNNLDTLVNDAHEFVDKHTVVAMGIDAKEFYSPETGVYGRLFRLEGNVASPVQFFLTDSVSHYLYGAAYIWAEPNADSLAPVNTFLQKEVERFFRTIHWHR